jgi:hypothetical protein
VAGKVLQVYRRSAVGRAQAAATIDELTVREREVRAQAIVLAFDRGLVEPAREER